MTTTTTSDRDRAIECLARLAPWRAEDREQHYRVGMACRSVSDDLYGPWLAWSRQAPNFNERYCRSNWRSFKPGGGVTLGTLIHMARQDSGEQGRDVAVERMAKLRAEKANAPTEAPRVERDWSAIVEAAQIQIDNALVNAIDEGLGLGLTPESLRRLAVGWWSADLTMNLRRDVPREHQRGWTFPMRDWTGRPIGVRLRLIDDDAIAVYGSNKVALPDSANGLFIPEGVAGGDGALVVVEGPTDCAAVLDMGMPAIGRPSNTGGADLVRWFIAARRPDTDRVVILIDRDQPDSDVAVEAIRQCVIDVVPDDLIGDQLREYGLSAAERSTAAGAIKLQRLLAGKREVYIAAPPRGVKDARDWRRTGAGLDDLEHAIDLAVRLPSRRFDWMRRVQQQRKGAA